MRSKEPVYLLDAFHYIFRAYYAVRPLATSKGLPTNAIFGFVRMLLKILKDKRPSHIGVFFDRPEPTFRKALYAEYKANRLEAPEDLAVQIDWVKRVVSELDIPLVEKVGYEADDLIGTAARLLVEAGHPVVIISGDKDLMQLVSSGHGPQVLLWDTMKEREIGRDGVIERFGVGPEQVVDVLALAGDASDNIPGVRGIGEKTASALIARYGSLDALYEHLAEIPGKKGEWLREQKDAAYLSRKLATIDCHVDWTPSLEALKQSPPQWDKLRVTLAELEFSRLWKEIEDVYAVPLDPQAPSSPVQTLPVAPETQDARGLAATARYCAVLTFEALAQVLQALERVDRFAFDTETTGLDPHRAELVGISLAWTPGEAVYIPLGHTADAVQLPQLPKSAVLSSLKPFLENPRWKKIGQNLKYDTHILRREDIHVHGLFADTMIAGYLLDPEGSHSLDTLAQKYLSYTTIHYEEVAGKGGKAICFSAVPLAAATPYACQDADVAYRLYLVLDKLLGDKGLSPLFYTLEMPVCGILVDMEEAGILLDTGKFSELSRRFETELAALETKIHAEAGEVFNIQSPKQLARILFEKLGLPVISRTKTGPSTAADVLEALARVHHATIAVFLIEHRELSKLKSTYVDKLPLLVNPATGRIHTCFNQAATATGRLSSSDPNLQNIPIRGDEGALIREAFVAPRGSVLLSLDYSQIELRLLAEFSRDDVLIDIFEKGEDCHRRTASGLFAVAVDAVTEAQRRVGKTINFATIYGQGPYSLSARLGIGVGEAKAYIDAYFKTYPKVRPYRDKILEEARRRGYVETVLGRRRYVPDLVSRNKTAVAAAERVAFNAVIQGSAADVVKLAMIRCGEYLRERASECRLLLQVHDELVCEVVEERVEGIARGLQGLMQGVMPAFSVPLSVDYAWGKNWAAAH